MRIPSMRILSPTFKKEINMKVLIPTAIFISAITVTVGCAAGQAARAGKTVGRLIVHVLGVPRGEVEKKEEKAKSRLLVIIDPNNSTSPRTIIITQ